MSSCALAVSKSHETLTAHSSLPQRFIFDFRVLKGDVEVEAEGGPLGIFPSLELHHFLQLLPGKQIPETPL